MYNVTRFFFHKEYKTLQTGKYYFWLRSLISQYLEFFPIVLLSDPLFIIELLSDTLFTTQLLSDPLFITELVSDPLFISGLHSNPLFTTELLADPLFHTELLFDPLFTTELLPDPLLNIELLSDLIFTTGLLPNPLFTTELLSDPFFLFKPPSYSPIHFVSQSYSLILFFYTTKLLSDTLFCPPLFTPLYQISYAIIFVCLFTVFSEPVALAGLKDRNRKYEAGIGERLLCLGFFYLQQGRVILNFSVLTHCRICVF